KDWTLKPAGEVFVDLVTKQWWTDESAKTDGSGVCRLRGFLGHYQVTATVNGKSVQAEIQLGREGQQIRVEIK
ncbi:hypothetical protein N9224_02125, partial [Akkermansiaceae bacterium]|nr:hypothetical protein [Akkermansiaceae bacterium]